MSLCFVLYVADFGRRATMKSDLARAPDIAVRRSPAAMQRKRYLLCLNFVPARLLHLVLNLADGYSLLVQVGTSGSAQSFVIEA